MMQFNQEQQEVIDAAINWFYNSQEQLFQFDGPPGSGKSSILREILSKLNLNLYSEVAPMSFIGAATLVMRRNGLINAKTIHSWCYTIGEDFIRDENGNISYDDSGIAKKHIIFIPKTYLEPFTIKLIIIDEAYCTPLSMRPLLQSYGIKILACGDSNQLPPVNDKPAFLIDGNIYHLTKVMRQSGRMDIISIARAAQIGAHVNNGNYGNSIVIDRDGLTNDMLLWADVIICGTNKTRDMINNYMRQLLGFTGPLPNYGEKVVCRNNNWTIEAIDSNNCPVNLVNGLIGTVDNQPMMVNLKSRTFKMNFKCDTAGVIFRGCDVNYNYITSNHQDRLKIKSLSTNNHNNGQLFEFAYCITCHISQGSQFDKVIYIEESLGSDIQPALNLVGCTRAVKSLIYVKNSKLPFKIFNNNGRQTNPIYIHPRSKVYR